MENTNITILPLLEKSELSSKMKNDISRKLNNLVFILENIHSNKHIDVDEDELIYEIKSTAKILVKKSDKFQKDIISSALRHKEESLETLEISKLRIEAQMKDLKKKENALMLRTNHSLFSTLKINLTRLFSNKKKSIPSIEQTLNDYKAKLYNYDLEKNKISQLFYENGSKKLELLRKNTYKILCTSKYTVSTESLISLKERIKHL